MDVARRVQAGRAITRLHRRYGPGWRSVQAVVLVMAATVFMAGCRPPACAQPYPAAAWQGLNTDPTPWPEGSVGRQQRTWVFDSDGDGVEDTVDGATDAVVPAITVHRGSGDLVFTAPDGVIARPQQFARDFDGDGRSEIEVSTADALGQLGSTYLVAGSTADGIYDPADAGVLTPGRIPFGMETGDVDGDGAQDLVNGDLRTTVISGRDLMAPGPGGTFEGPVLELPSDLIGRPVPLSPTLDGLVMLDSGRAQIVLWVNGTSIRFTADNTPVPIHGEAVRMFAWLADGPDGKLWLVAQLAAPHPMVAEAEWAWDLGSLCDGPSSVQIPAIAPHGA